MHIREYEGPIVVGIDGSDNGVDAARWAAGEAVARGVALRLIHVMSPIRHVENVFGAPDVDRDYGNQVLAAAVSAAGANGSSVPVSVELVTGSASDIFLEESHSASLVVLGSASTAGIRTVVLGSTVLGSTLLGSTALGVAEAAACPVVLVHRFNANATGPVILDLRTGDGTGAGSVWDEDPVAAQAFKTADGRWVGVRSVHTESVMKRLAHVLVTPNVLQKSAGELDRLTPWTDLYPSTPIDSINVRIDPAQNLAALTQDAQVMVVGHRRGKSFGPGLHAALEYAGCPVLVVPHA